MVVAVVGWVVELNGIDRVSTGLVDDTHPCVFIYTQNTSGVPKTSTMTEIKKAYRRKVVKMHPDKARGANLW